MKNRSFWDGLVMGAAGGMFLGLLVLARRKEMTHMEKTRLVLGRTARRALRRAQGTLGRVAGRFSD